MRLVSRLVCRPGFTLVELLVSIVLIDVGLLALVAGSAVVVRRQAEVRAHGAAVRLATNRLQTLAAGPCAASSGTTPAPRAMTEAWSAEARPNGTIELSDSVAFAVGGVAHSVVLRTRLPC